MHQLDDPAAVPAVCVFQVLSNPRLDVGDLWEGIARRLLACVELREANAEAHLVDIRIWDQVIGRGRHGWVDKQIEQSLCSQPPPLGVAVNEGLRLAESLGERDNRSLAVGRPGQLLGIRENNCEVDRLEDAVQKLANARIV